MEQRKKIAAVITGADHPTGLGTARALKSTKVDLIGLCSDQKSRYCRSNVWDQIIPVGTNPKSFLDTLLKIGQSNTSDQVVLFPTQDDAVQVVSKHRNELSKYYKFILPSEDSVSLLMNKIAFQKWVEECGYTVPESYIMESQEELDEILHKIKYPIIIKPALRTIKWELISPVDKAYKLYKKEDFKNIDFDLFQVSSQILVQQWIPGGDESLHFCLMYIDRNGRELGYYTGHKLLQWPIGVGSTAFGVGTFNHQVYELTQKVLREAGLRGLGSLEVKLNKEDNKYYIIEPTVGRNDLQSFIAVAGGVNLTQMAFYDAIGETHRVRSEKKMKAIWIEEYSAFQAIKSSNHSKNSIAGKILREVLTKKMSFANFSITDPMPFVHLLKKIFYRKTKNSFISRVSEKVISLLKEKGIKGAIFSLMKYLKHNLFRYARETYYVFETNLDKSIPTIKPKIDVELYKIQPNEKEDIDELISFWPDCYRFSQTGEGLRKGIDYYFESGDECFCIKHKNKIVAMSWIGYQGNYMLKSMAKKDGLSKDSVILHRGFVSDEMRGSNLYGFLLSELSNYAKNNGYKKWFAYVGIANSASLYVHTKMCDSYRLLHHLQITIFGFTVNLFPKYSKKVTCIENQIKK